MRHITFKCRATSLCFIIIILSELVAATMQGPTSYDMDFNMYILYVHAYVCHVTGNDLKLHEHLLITCPQSYEHCDHTRIS